jgi:hypothetical protein
LAVRMIGVKCERKYRYTKVATDMKNNNQKVIRHLSNQSLKSNKMRNIFAITAISLTALLFTALFSLGIGMIQITEEQSMRQDHRPDDDEPPAEDHEPGQPTHGGTLRSHPCPRSANWSTCSVRWGSSRSAPRAS